ncbi:MAG: mannonate dehydratase [Salinirussus sp.]
MSTAAEPDRDRLAVFDDLPLRVGWGTYRSLESDRLSFVRQLGVEDLLIMPWPFEDRTGAIPRADKWGYDQLRRRRDRVEDAGLRLTAIEMLPRPLYEILLADSAERERLIEGVRETVRNLGRVGIPILGYSGLPPSGVGRTSRDATVRGGARTTAFNGDAVDHEPIMADPPSEAELWDRYEMFLEAVLPVAEEWGVTLAAHPSDPPIEELGGVPLLFRSREAFDRALSIVPSDNHGLKFCVGCWSEMGEDVPAIIDHFGDDIAYVHFRDVIGTLPRFTETFLDDPESNFAAYDVMAALDDAGFSGVMTPDHVPQVVGEEPMKLGGPRGHAFTVGYLKGVLEGITRR